MLLLFDLMIGVTYHDVAQLRAIDSTTVELTGTARALKMIIQSMNECPGLKYQINVPVESLQENYIEDPVQRFIKEKGCSMVLDDSSYTVQFKKLS